jgi:hypothetical protein
LEKVATIHYQQENFAIAVQYYERLFYLNPVEHDVIENLIDCSEKLNDFENAKKWREIKLNQR